MKHIDQTTLAAAKDLLEHHKKQSQSPMRQKNLDLLWAALEDMRKAGATRYGIAEVGRKLESMNGPKTQSLRNVTGAAFREVISFYESGFKRSASESELDGIERALATVSNVSAKQILRDAVTSAKAVTKQRDQLKTAMALMELAHCPPPGIPALQVEGIQLPGWIFETISSNFDSSRLRDRGLAISEDGCLQDERQIAFFGPDLLGAMNEILTLHGRPPISKGQP